MRLRSIHWSLSVLLLAVSFSVELNAQTTTSGGLAGVVTDPTHAVVPGANVEIKNSGKSTTQSTKTDRQGEYRFFFLTPGRYTLTVTRGDFRTESREVNVLLGPPVSVNVTLTNTGNASLTISAPLIRPS